MAFAVEGSMQNGYPPELRENVARFANFRARWLGNDPSSYATIYRMLTGTDLADELTRLKCPVLVVGAELDRVRPPAVSEAIAKTIPGARYRALRTGHYMAAQTPELIADAISEFLKSVDA
jgi:3-oxoadipate enol-lactonase